ncbi:MAG: type VII secretion protein EssC [Bacilli bacterium]
MRVSIIRKNKIENHILPAVIYGNYWIQDKDSKDIKRNLINVEEENKRWKLKSNFETQIMLNNDYKEFVYLEDFGCYTLVTKGEAPILLYCTPTYDNHVQQLVVQNGELLIGNQEGNAIVYKTNYISPQQLKLSYINGIWSFQNLDIQHPIFVNMMAFNSGYLSNGDILFIMGLKIIILGNTIFVNNPNNLVSYRPNVLNQILSLPKYEKKEYIENEDLQVFETQDYFFRAPRFRTTMEQVEIKIDAPPTKEKDEKMPMIYTVGPMLTMGMTAMVTGITSLNNVLNGKQSWSTAMPSLVIAGAMMMSMIFWPLLSKKYEKKQRKKYEKMRQEKYKKYIESKRQQVFDTINTQRNTLVNSLVPLDECKNIILERRRNLWERKLDHEDFLNLRLGIGNQDPKIKISYPEAHFTLDEDNLRPILDEVVAACDTITDVPLDLNFTKEFISAIVGQTILTTNFMAGLLLQMITFHSYEELKIVILTTKENEKRWDYLKVSPYCFDDDKTIRFFAADNDEANQISNYLNDIFTTRKFNEEEINDKDYRSFVPYYVIITDDFASIRNLEIIRSVLSQKINCGFSLIINNQKLLGLPNECTCFITINNKIKSTIFGNELIVNKQKEFTADSINIMEMVPLCAKVANIPIELDKEKYYLPKSISFLEMFDVGKVEQLNPISRWKNNNPVISLQAPVGVDQNGELFKLDLHEKFHGPHGLVAGMTGSGKSEFIITYILSMAINYHPYEVSFVLIDYKGGGLAGAFENKETGIKLPHLAGSITNLDTVSLNRSLASIQSELRRRQKMFNKARELLNESTIDIYKYQKLFRAGAVKDPIPHLFIISDEFAELKTQQPEFMEQLISTARIGRSLGVHLILATQKPSGVVDDQIWSNSRFRVCLKVQEKSDSVDMIKRPDAATLKNVGRFYLQVGYNEFFALGQSAWCGAPYLMSDKRKKTIDTNVDFINNVGYVVKSNNHKKEDNIVKNGEELPNIVNYLNTLAKEQNIHTEQLWLDQIPDVILVKNLKTKYQYVKKNYNINPIIGEYDDPFNQQQHLLTLPLSKDGNVIIYGAVGSGKENLLTTIIYSTITEYSPAEINLYILDFGAETLKNFLLAPQVGDVLLSNDQEKINNLFKMLSEAIEKRKKLFVEYNGNYQTYCEKSQNPLPTILVIINYYEAFQEIFPEFEDIVIQLTREGLKYGIVFVLTTNGTSSIRYRLRQNFNQELVLQMNDEGDYGSILGNVHGMHPSKIKGRGLVKFDDIHEFQAAYPCPVEEIVVYIKDVCEQFKNTSKIRAKAIPVLPKEVNLEFLKPFVTDTSSIPIGVEKDSLDIVKVNFKDKYLTYITALEEISFNDFILNLIAEVSTISNTSTIVVDCAKMFEQPLPNCVYFKNNFDEVYKKIDHYFDQLKQCLVSNESAFKQSKEIICIIIGLEKFKSKLSDEFKNKFDDFMIKGKDLGKVTFIVADTIDKMKKLEYDKWYKECTSNNNGIWIGNGIADQFTMKLSKTPRYIQDTVDECFGYYVKAGNPILIKLLGKKETNE